MFRKTEFCSLPLAVRHHRDDQIRKVSSPSKVKATGVGAKWKELARPSERSMPLHQRQPLSEKKSRTILGAALPICGLASLTRLPENLTFARQSSRIPSGGALCCTCDRDTRKSGVTGSNQPALPSNPACQYNGR
jgi:hypothetical protein